MIQPTRYARTILGIVFLTAAFAAPMSAQLREDLDSVIESFRSEHDIPGMVVGLTGPAGERVRSFGVASRESGAAVDENTRFEIGSVAKVFTGLLLAELAVRGEVDLHDAASQHLPDGTTMPAHPDGPITLDQLSTHTSGLPRLPSNLAPADLADPYADYAEEHLYAFLDGYRLPRPAGESFEYSNLGVGLLGHLLAGRAGESFARLMQARILQPLGLADTYVPDGRAADPAMAQPHSDAGPVAVWDFGVLQGAGAIHSTASDLLRFLRAQLDAASSPLGEALRLSQQVHASGPQGVELGLGWHIAELPGGVRIFWHLGGTGGSRSFVAFTPDRALGLVVLANRDVPLAEFDQFALRIFLAALE